MQEIFGIEEYLSEGIGDACFITCIEQDQEYCVPILYSFVPWEDMAPAVVTEIDYGHSFENFALNCNYRNHILGRGDYLQRRKFWCDSKIWGE